MKRLVYILLFFANISFAEYQIGDQTTLTILPTIDTSGLNVSTPMQQALGQLLYQTGKFKIQFSSYSLGGFTVDDLAQTFDRLDTDQVAFSYLENGRISLFLFDSSHPKEFIVISQGFQAINTLGTAAYQTVQYHLQQAVQQALYQYAQEQYQQLPGADLEEEGEEGSVESKAKATVSKQLFLEYAASQTSAFYIGASIGMARFAANRTSASVVDLGIYGGRKINQRFTAELGLNLFSYAFAYTSVKYQLPILKENYVSMLVSGNVGFVVGAITENLGFESTNIRVGQIMAGPGAEVIIPLLGARIRAGLKLMIGGGSVIMGHYGLTYTI